MMKARRALTVAAIATAAVAAVVSAVLFLRGGKAPEAPLPPPDSSESYMNDPAFRKGLSERRMVRERLTAELKAVRDRIAELEAGENGKSAPELDDLRRKAAETEKNLADARREMLRYVRGRLVPGAGKKQNEEDRR